MKKLYLVHFKELKTHLLDHTFPANQETPLGPPSLGVRTAALKVRAFNKKEMEHWGLPLKTNVPHSQAIAHAEEIKGSILKVSRNLQSTSLSTSSSSITVEMEKTGLIGEHYALIFAPIWVISVPSAQGKTDFLVDGLSHTVIKKPKAETEKLTTSLTPDKLGFEQGDLRFIPFRCPVCGWDFPFHPLNVVNLCTTCGRAWREKDGSYLEVPYNVVKKKEERRPIIYLPFWTFNVAVTTPEKKISTVDQFYQLFPPPRLFKPEKEQNRAIKFYIPAFRIKSIPRVNKFAALFTQNQPNLEYLEDHQKKDAVLNNTVGNVFLNPSESQEMAEIVLYSLIPTNSRKAKKFVSQAQLFFSGQQLEWHSFQETNYDFREENTGYAFQKKAIEL